MFLFVSAYRPTSGKLRQIQTLEEWYLIFSLLSATTVSSDSRPYVWASLKHIIEANLISDVNFSPARHLLLRFLFG